jgi:DnaD/phage-associated family protein
MARPKKQTIEYFPHYVNHHKTMFVLESKYRNDGYAFWFKLLEVLGSTNGMFYDCNNIADWEFLLAKTHLSGETANSILDTLAGLGAIDRELWREKIIWSQNLVDNVRDAFKRRITEMPVKPSLCIQEPHLSDVYADKNGERKVKETKVKETKTNTCDSDGFNIYKFLEKCNFIISPMLGEKLGQDIRDYSLEEVKKAIEIADSNGKHSYSYVKGILEKRRSGENHKLTQQQEFEKAKEEFLND